MIPGCRDGESHNSRPWKQTLAWRRSLCGWNKLCLQVFGSSINLAWSLYMIRKSYFFLPTIMTFSYQPSSLRFALAVSLWGAIAVLQVAWQLLETCSRFKNTCLPGSLLGWALLWSSGRQTGTIHWCLQVSLSNHLSRYYHTKNQNDILTFLLTF